MLIGRDDSDSSSGGDSSGSGGSDGSGSSKPDGGVGGTIVEGRRLVAPQVKKQSDAESKAKANPSIPSRGARRDPSDSREKMEKTKQIRNRRPQQQKPSWWENPIPSSSDSSQRAGRPRADKQPKSGMQSQSRPRQPSRNANRSHKSQQLPQQDKVDKPAEALQSAKGKRSSRPRGPIGSWQPPPSATSEQKTKWKGELRKLTAKIKAYDKVGAWMW